MPAIHAFSRKTHGSLGVFGAVLALLGLTLALGGVRLLMLGGSWYYLLAGLCIVIAGALLILGRIAGAWLYGAVFLGTLFWTLWESGLDFWGYVPRLALLLLLAIILAMLLPRLENGPPRRVARGLAAVLTVAFLGAIVWAFAPHNTFRSGATVARSSALALRAVPASGALVQPADAPADSDWAAYGRSNAATRYSPLRRINVENVGRLQRAWVYRTGDMPIEGMRKWGAETTPLKIGDAVYLCSGMNQLIALDAASGKELWRYDPRVAKEFIPYTAACRGVAFYEAPQLAEDAPCRRRIIEGTLDARLIAVDAETGQACQDFGRGFGVGGEVSLTLGMGEVFPAMVAVTSPPTIVRGVAVVGHLGLVYVPMGNSAADYYSGSRTDIENKHNTAIVALDALTGDVRWVFQTIHIDVWDYDLGSQPTLVDLPAADGAVAALIVPAKQGDIYVLNRATGQPLTAVEERPAPRGKVPDNPLSATQPHSTAMPVLRKPDLRERDMWGLTPIDQLYCRIQFAAASYEGIYTAPTLGQRWIQWPGYNGGNDWGSVAVDIDRGILVANYSNVPMFNRLITRAQAEKQGLVALGMPGGSSESAGPQPMIGTPYAADISPWQLKFTGMLCNEPPYGSITAIDLATREVLWDLPLGTARRNGPFGIPTHLPIAIGTPNNGGPIVTAGGLIFIAAATDDLLRAMDVDTGEILWTDALPAGGQATPMTYEAGGEQYILMVAGGHHFMETPAGDYVIAYKLPAGTRSTP